MELIIVAAALVIMFSVSLWLIHRQTIHARDMQAMFLQRQQFNFEHQWKLWLADHKTNAGTIQALASWNTHLCENNDLRHQQLMSLVNASMTQLNVQLTSAVGDTMRKTAQQFVTSHAQQPAR